MPEKRDPLMALLVPSQPLISNNAHRARMIVDLVRSGLRDSPEALEGRVMEHVEFAQAEALWRYALQPAAVPDLLADKVEAILEAKR